MSKVPKVVVVGPPGSGKTALVSMLRDIVPPDRYDPTVGFTVHMIKLTTFPELTIRLWDTSGDPKYAAVCSNTFTDASAGIVVVEPNTSLSIIQEWIDTLKSKNPYMLIILVWSKLDEYKRNSIAPVPIDSTFTVWWSKDEEYRSMTPEIFRFKLATALINADPT